ncbi:MAG: helix-turn-helix domain-containing protein [Wenzhouxiangellaceae bacterium]
MEKISKSVSKRSNCPIATTLDVIGDKWSLLIIRDIALFDKHKNKEFQEAGENIPTNILANRLKLLVDVGIIEKHPYQNNPLRYEYVLTHAGRNLVPVLQSIAVWAEENIEGIVMPDTSAIAGRGL